MTADDHHGLTPKQEAFACAYVETGNASEAYRRSGYSNRQSAKAINENSSKLLTKVLPRVEQLRAAHAEGHNITVDSITEMLKEDREKAHAAGQIGAAVSASMGLAKLHGLIVDKTEVKKAGDGDLAGIPTDELETIVRAGIAGAAEAAKSPRKPDSVH